MTALREACGNDGEKPIGNLTCRWRRDLRLMLALGPRTRRPCPWARRSSPGGVPAPEPEGTGNDCLGDSKSRLVCVCSILGRGVGRVVSPFEQVGSAPRLIALTSSWEPRPLLQTCAWGPPAFKVLHFGPLTVAMVPAQSIGSIVMMPESSPSRDSQLVAERHCSKKSRP